MLRAPDLRRAACALALGVAAVALAPARARAVDDPACGTMLVPTHPGTLAYRLPHRFLRAGSDSVWLGATALARDRDYALDRVRGELRLLREATPGDTLRVAACWLLAPPPTELQLLRYHPVAAAAPDTAPAAPATVPRPATARNPAVAPSGTALVVSGNKTLSVDFGSSQDAFVRQSLDLAVSGSLGPGLNLTGVLSDRNVPISETGSTASLQSFDRVLLELTAPQGSAALGDVAVNLNRGEFARLDRRVQGMRADVAVGALRGQIAAANAQGQYQRMQFFGAEGRQGPYLLTDDNGATGIAVVPGSEAVTVDGVRMTRGEGADYSMDYERGQLTFSNRRVISADTRITVDYQFTVTRYRRNLATAGLGWDVGRLSLYTQAVTESDDRGHPLSTTLTDDDRLVLAAAGDSASRAVGSGITPGVGDYDSVRVDPATLIYAFAGPDSGHFAVQFTSVALGTGDYQDSASVAGRTIYHWVGPGHGAFRIGRTLPLPQLHQLVAVGGTARAGPLSADVEGAVSRLNPNTFSSLDDAHHTGDAGRVRVALEGALPGFLGAGGLAVSGRSVGARFSAFSRLETPFEQESWGLPLDGDLEHQRRAELSGFVKPRAGGQLSWSLTRLSTLSGFDGLRRAADWQRDGRLATRFLWERSEGALAGRQFKDGGRDHLRGEARLRLTWLEPAFHAESDQRRTPSDSIPVGDRYREWGAELASGRALPWRASASWTMRRNAQLVTGAFVNQSDARTVRTSLDSPEERPFGISLTAQRRDILPLADLTRTRSDLATLRLRGDDRDRGLKSRVSLEVTNEGENQRTRTLTFVGAGRGAYDSFGNFVGRGDYDLVLGVSPALDRVARAATSAGLEWQAADGAVRGSRVELRFEGEARRRGDLVAHDLAVSPGAALGDSGLVHGSVLQRVQAESPPEFALGGLRLLLERRVTGDRTYENYAQTQDDRQAALRWRSRPGPKVTGEVEAKLARHEASEALFAGSGLARRLTDAGGTGQLIVSPDARLKVAGALEVTWERAADQSEATRTIRIGPDVGVALGRRGRLEETLRRAFLAGPPPESLIPSALPPGAPRWDSQTRIDYRVRESTTFGLSLNAQEWPDRPSLVTGRADLRAFF